MDIKELARQYINDVYNLELDNGFIGRLIEIEFLWFQKQRQQSGSKTTLLTNMNVTDKQRYRMKKNIMKIKYKKKVSYEMERYHEKCDH